MARASVKTVEFWVGILAAVFVGVQRYVWPQAPFPMDSVITLTSWISARLGEKTLGTVDPATGKRAWETGEFWVAIIFSVAKVAFPAIPEDMLYLILPLIFGRAAVKTFQDFSISKLTKKTTDPQIGEKVL
jgi:hypothetical protein